MIARDDENAKLKQSRDGKVQHCSNPMPTQCVTRSFRIEGDVGADRFCGWIADHARKLGVRLQGISSTRHSLLVEVSGPGEMVDALMVACLLGPSSVMVDDVVLLDNSTNPCHSFEQQSPATGSQL